MMRVAQVLKMAGNTGSRQMTTAIGETPRLVDFPWKAAGIIVAAMGSAISAVGFFGKILHEDNLATRGDLQNVRTEIQSARAEVKADVQALRSEVKADVQALRSEIKAEVQTFRSEIQEVRKEAREAREATQIIRVEVQTARREAREDNLAARAEIKELREDMRAGFKSISDRLDRLIPEGPSHGPVRR
jgi:hypothetical protein